MSVHSTFPNCGWFARWATGSVAGLTVAISPLDGWAAAEVVDLPPDRPIVVRGVEVACTGIGETRNDPQWLEYGVRVEFSDALSQYLGSGAIRLRDSTGAELLAVACDGPWILLRIPPGSYSVEAWVPGSKATALRAPAKSPRTGQVRIVFQFNDA